MRTNTKSQFFHRVMAASLLVAMLLTLLPAPASADEGIFVFIPVVNNGPGNSGPGNGGNGEENPDPDMTDEALMAEARIQLPDPKLVEPADPKDPADDDVDGDGVPNETDICPFQPNPPRDGKQPVVCGPEVRKIIDDLVFLKARTFRPTRGLGAGLLRSPQQERIHALLHVHKSENGVVLYASQRQQLEAAGVTILGYLPHYTFYVSLPNDIERLQQIVDMERVYGISAIRPRDKVAPQVRLRGPINGRNEDGTFSFDVDFHSDVPTGDIEATLNRYGLPFEFQYDTTYRITLSSWEQFRRLAIQDMTYWIDDTPGNPLDETLNGQSVVGALTVSNTLGYRGNGLVVSMTETAHAGPVDHPDMNGRIIEGNSPAFMGSPDPDHAQMVSAIMIADETSFPDRRGILPDAELVTYSNSGVITIKRQHFGIPKEAREDHDALLSNNSWGRYNCNKIGEYTKRAKFFDKAVHEIGVVITKAAGNGRGNGGFFNDPDKVSNPCPVDLYSLPHTSTAKNTLTVANMSITQQLDATLNGISDSSSAGPTADGRMKPDITAPGNGIFTVDYLEASNTVTTSIGSGTSAAGPFAAGIVGLLAESFENQGTDANSVDPSRYKAILVHTARDEGVSGPDYYHGYGLIQADKALRIAEEWQDWGRTGNVSENDTQDTFIFDVTTPMAFYKATLVWDDKKGEHTSSMALKNDLDLTLISPSGVVYYPWDLVLPVGATTDDGSEPCTSAACQDRLNNVEQVLAEPTVGDFIEQGTWEARVTVNRLVTNDQDYSLVLTPPCPVVLNSNVTLTQDIDCQPNLLEPSGVVIESDGVDLNCDNYAVIGNDAKFDDFSGTWVGIRSHADNVTIRNCEVRRFDVGISVEDDADGSQSNNTVKNNDLHLLGSLGVKLEGDSHTARLNNVYDFVWSNGVGIKARGDNLAINENEFFTPVTSGGVDSHTVAIDVIFGSENGTVNDNGFSGWWMQGIRLRSGDALEPVRNMTVSGNHFEGINQTPIMLLGNVQNSTVTGNEVFAYGDGFPGVSVINNEAGFQPSGNTVSSNIIAGFTTQKQKGIRVREGIDTQVLNNSIGSVAIGIVEQDATGTVIQSNLITSNPGDDFRADVGIRSLSSEGLTGGSVHIASNTIISAVVGIELSEPVAASVTGNTVDYTDTGIDVLGNGAAVIVSSNTIVPNALGIAVADSPASAISANSIYNRRGTSFSGISLTRSDGARLSRNGVTAPASGISVTASKGVSVTNNTVSDPGTSAIYLNTASLAFVDGNDINDNATVGIQYAGGDDAVLSNNEVTSVVSGVGIRLGDGTFPGCVIDVDNILVQDNVLTGGAATIEQLCDVGTATLINN